MIYKLSIQLRHLRIHDKLFSLSGLISAHRRESWVGVTLASWLYKTERLQLHLSPNGPRFRVFSNLSSADAKGFANAVSGECLK